MVILQLILLVLSALSLGTLIGFWLITMLDDRLVIQRKKDIAKDYWR